MKRKVKILVVLLAAALTLYSIAGCASPAAPAASRAPGGSAGAYVQEEAPATQAPAAATSLPEPAPGLGAPDAKVTSAQDNEEPYFHSNKGKPYNHTQKPYDTSSEEYGRYKENEFKSPSEDPLSTFSIDVDTASYSNIRRYLQDGMLPPEDAVRVEECINYFSYDYAAPTDAPVAADVMISGCPWNEGRYLARVSLKARETDRATAPVSNLVFLLDVSGSMEDANKLPLVKHTMEILTENIRNSDRVSIVTYSDSTNVVLEGCSGEDKDRIRDAIDNLHSGGSTAGGAGIELAYETAKKYYLQGGNNRVILCTDGDFNVGITSSNELEDLIAQESKSGVFLTVLGYGMGNIKDNKMETLADKGNGNYAYIDTREEAEKVVDEEIFSTLYTVAKDVKVQVEFNPDAVKEYRLIGYDNRILNPSDFNDNSVDAGEMGAGHCVTAFYELILVNSPENSGNVDDLVFQSSTPKAKEPESDWMYVKVRYKQPDSGVSQLITRMAGAEDYTKYPDKDYMFASAVTEFALLLKNSKYAGDASFENLISHASDSIGFDRDGYRTEFLDLATRASHMMR